MFNRSEVIMLTNKQTLLKISTTLRYAASVGNELGGTVYFILEHVKGVNGYRLIVSYIQRCCRYRDGAGNTIEENSSVFSLIQMQ